MDGTVYSYGGPAVEEWKDAVGRHFFFGEEMDAVVMKDDEVNDGDAQSSVLLKGHQLEEEPSERKMRLGAAARPGTPEPRGEEEIVRHAGQNSLQGCEDKSSGKRAGRTKGRAGGAANRVTLNVGGKIFETSVETLSLDSHSMLAAKVTRYMADADEVIWIDRDPGRFRHVLNYLRSQTIYIDEIGELRAIQEEADFFNLNGLHQLCEDKIQETVNVKDETQTMLQRLEDLHGNLKALTENLENLKSNHRKEPISGVRRRRLDYGNYNEPIFRMDEDF